MDENPRNLSPDKMLIQSKENKIKFDVFWKDEQIGTFEIDFNNQKVKAKQYTWDTFKRPVMKKDKDVTVEDLLSFFKDRCFPYDRANRDDLLKALKLNYYSPLQIVKKTHGLTYDDYLWLRFDGEGLTYEDVRIRD
jgi:hypothetical protein